MLTPETSYVSLINEDLLNDDKYRLSDLFSVDQQRVDQLQAAIKDKLKAVLVDNNGEGRMALNVKAMMEAITEFKPQTENEAVWASFICGDLHHKILGQVRMSNEMVGLGLLGKLLARD